MFQWLFKRRKVDYVVIHSMPKAATVTLERSLAVTSSHLQIVRTHFLTPRGIALLRQKAEMPDITPQGFHFVQKQIALAVNCVEEIEKRQREGKPYCVISGYRDPLDQFVSAQFQALPHWPSGIDLDSPDLAGQAALVEEKFETMFRRLVVEQKSPLHPRRVPLCHRLH